MYRTGQVLTFMKGHLIKRYGLTATVTAVQVLSEYPPFPTGQHRVYVSLTTASGAILHWPLWGVQSDLEDLTNSSVV